MISNNTYYEYKIKNGDTFSGIVHRMFGHAQNDTRYKETVKYLLTLNPQIKNPDRIRAGDMLRLGVLPPTPQPVKSNPIIPPTFITESVHPNDMESFWMLAWLEQNANFLTIPGGIVAGSAGNLLSPGNVGLINEVSDQYAKYKSGNITKAQYDYRRKKALDRLKKNIGPFEDVLFGKHTTHESIRIARAGGIPATANITQHANKLKSLAAVSKGAGIALVGVGLTAACMQIASTADTQEKNKIFVETITSTVIGGLAGIGVGIFLIFNPISWGAAIVLATSSVAASYASGKGASFLAYDVFGMEVDLVSGAGVDRICQ